MTYAFDNDSIKKDKQISIQQFVDGCVALDEAVIDIRCKLSVIAKDIKNTRVGFDTNSTFDACSSEGVIDQLRVSKSFATQSLIVVYDKLMSLQRMTSSEFTSDNLLEFAVRLKQLELLK